MTLEVTHRQPGSDRFNAVAAAIVFTPAGMAFGLVAAAVLVSQSSPTGWLIVAVFTIAGVAPLGHWRRATREPSVSVAGLSFRWQRVLIDAVHTVNRMELVAESVPEGPTHDHFEHCCSIARDYVRAIEMAAHASPHTNTIREAATITQELSQLSLACAQLAREAGPHGQSPIRDLTEQTKLMAESLREVSTDPPRN